MSAVADKGGPEGEAKAALMLRLRSRGVRTLAVMRAIETVPREAFLEARLAPYALQDIALPIGCGQTTAEPSFIARQLEALDCTPESSVLEIGSGSGYVTALLTRLAGSAYGLERYRGLADAAQGRLSAMGLASASVAWADGLDGAGRAEPFDRIVLHAAVPTPPSSLLDRLRPGGVMVCPLTSTDGRQDLVRLQLDPTGTITAVRICASRLQAAVPGASCML